ncbi:hypothetical protein [Methanosarcina vacuolata]|uniref:Pycsar effector protein domain-containing protein n=1 Tax=Methanosarcina vacuolata Z-761 TaxID=1434123 RepID=A0A0E3Q7M9_9EURY|nr:hypothetical protein [Methanosarcina vacuolata]AKB44847.1 hypothetical protein MSVAZ_2578 [Methanosarcina vacuolata Z-761]
MMDNIKFDEISYNIIFERYQREFQRTLNIENKASNVVGFVGVIFGLDSISGLYVFEQIKTGDLSFGSILFYVLSLVFLIISILLAVKVLYVKERYIVPELTYFMENYVKTGKSKEMILYKLSELFVYAVDGGCKFEGNANTNIRDKFEGNASINDRNANLLRYSFSFFLSGVVTSLIFMFSVLIGLYNSFY